MRLHACTVGALVLLSASLARAQTPPDTTPPAAQWLTPAADACVRGSVNLSAQVTDAESGVASVSVSVDGGAAQAMAAQGSDIYALVLDSLALTDGAHTLILQAQDQAGNSAQAALAVRVDNTPPAVAVTAPVEGASFCNGDVMAAHAEDAGCGLASITFYANDQPVATFDGSQADVSAPIDTTGMPDGPLVLRAEAADNAGNTASSQVTVFADNTPPDVAFVNPQDGATIKGTITIEATAADSDLSSVEFRVDGVSLGVMTAPPFVASFDTLTILDGTTIIEAIAVDHCGNVTIRTIAVTVDNIAFKLTPVSLNMRSKGGARSVTAHLKGENVALLIPTEEHDLRLMTPSGGSVQSTAGFRGDDKPGGSGKRKTLTVKFDRQALIAAIGPGEPPPEPPPDSGKKKPKKGKPRREMIQIRLLADNDREIGVVTIKIIR